MCQQQCAETPQAKNPDPEDQVFNVGINTGKMTLNDMKKLGATLDY
jgi:hypothetical protein